MKVYLFYLKVCKRKENTDYGIRQFLEANYKIMTDKYKGCIPVIRDENANYILYAFTNNKKLAEKFASQRKMKCFLYIKKNLSKEEYDGMKASMCGHVICDCKLNYESFQKSGDIDVALSEFESNLVEDEVEFTCFIRDKIFDYNGTDRKFSEEIPTCIFTGEVRKALDILLYPLFSPAIFHDASNDDMVEVDLMDSITYTFQYGRIQKLYTFISMFESIVREDVIIDGAN